MVRTKLLALLCVVFLSSIAAGQQAVGFVSPNVRDRMSYAEASESLISFEQKNFIAVADRVLCALSPHPQVVSAIGEVHEKGELGLEGAENSTVLRAPLTYEQMRYGVSLLGRYAHQEYVIVFEAEPSGPAQLITLTVPQAADRKVVESILDSLGVVYRTLVDARTILFYLPPDASDAAIEKAATVLHGSIAAEKGKGEIIGNDDRLKAAALYDAIIAAYEEHHPEQKLSTKLWSAEWHDAVARTCTAPQ